MRRVAFQTLGCKLNQVETDSLASQFQDAGYLVVSFEEPSDVVVINTCTVTNKSDRKSRNTISKALSLTKSPLIVVTGCYAENARSELEEKAQIDYLVPNSQKNLILSLVEAHFKGELAPLQKGDVFDFQSHGKVFHTRAFLKIQDGCDNFCSYCIIPSVRGPAVSRSLVQTVQAAQDFLQAGAKELILSGINIGRYQDGVDDLKSLIRALLALEGDFRLRISSLEPECFDLEFIQLFSHPKLCHQLHLCLQSGSSRILSAMARPYTLESFLFLVAEIRKNYPLFNLTTDIIVGFPGETEEDFDSSVSATKECAFSQVHVFKFSRRATTKADTLAGQIPEVLKTQRSQKLQKISDSQRLEYFRKHLGRVVRVLVEKKDEDGYCSGWSDEYLPLQFYSADSSWNTFQRVKILQVVTTKKEPFLLGEIIL